MVVRRGEQESRCFQASVYLLFPLLVVLFLSLGTGKLLFSSVFVSGISRFFKR